MTRQYDIILFGATSFVGKILSAHFVDMLRHKPDLKIALAARSEKKLNELNQSLKKSFDTVVVDAHDEVGLKRLCKLTSTVISTVGPYALYGEELVKACVHTGTHYCDLAGEPQWIHEMIHKYEEKAQTSGALIVHSAGFDSIPSDLGLLFLQHESQKRLGKFCKSVHMRVKAMGGAMSGGTIASMINLSEQVSQNPKLRKILANPYHLCPKQEHSKPRQKDFRKAAFDSSCQRWVAPFIMADINTRIVHRSHHLQGLPYGEDFRYDEATIIGRGLKGALKANTTSTVMAAFMLGTYFAPSRKVLKKILPKPGEGPSPEQQLRGYFDLRFFGHLDDVRSSPKIVVKVTGDRDPGYGSTAKMLAQAALCLTFDISKDNKKGGFWTPASLLGESLIDRLQTYAGLSFEVLETD